MRADRLLSLMLLLQARGKLTAQTLAEELEVSRRTILRDIDALSFAGIPIYAEGGHGGGIALDSAYRVRLNGLKEAEVQALILSNSAALLADIGLEDAAQSALLKLLAALPSLHARAARDFQNRVLVDPVWWWHGAHRLPQLEAVQGAVIADRQLAITYRKHNGAVIQRTVEPYGLVAKAGVWYLIAAHEARQYRSYRVSRLEAVAVLDESFPRDPDFDLAAFWRTRVETFLAERPLFAFTLRIPAEKQPFVQWYAPGAAIVLKPVRDGWFTARFEVETLDVAAMFVFGLGMPIEVIEPQALRDALRDRSQAMAAFFAGSA